MSMTLFRAYGILSKIIMKRKLDLSVVMILWMYSEFVCLNYCARGYCHWNLFSDFNHDLEWNVWLKKVSDVDFGMRASWKIRFCWL